MVAAVTNASMRAVRQCLTASSVPPLSVVKLVAPSQYSLSKIMQGNLIHIVTLKCKDAERAQTCLESLRTNFKPHADAMGCLAYEFGLQTATTSDDGAGTDDTVILVERWDDWAKLDQLVLEKVVPNIDGLNELLAAPFDAAVSAVRVTLS